ncbi:MAG TPA: ATP-binding protein [Longimicrobiaceae bacterium]|nr:ATP-binding protein [Longimicrobiaceae bacterium]
MADVDDDRNPFLPALIARGEHFADRESEVAHLLRVYSSPGSRLVVYGERRMGKSSALDRAAEIYRSEDGRVAIASLATSTDAADAAKSLLLAVREALGRDWREAFESIIGRLKGSVVITPGVLVGQPPSVRLTLDLSEEQPETSLVPEALSSIHQELEDRDLTLALVIDEFQRLHAWGGEDAEWALKAAIEQHPRIAYVLAGSQKSLIEAMISRKGRALWKQTEVLPFGPIPADEMSTWIHQQASRTGANFSLEACDRIVELAGPRTRDIVQLAREAWFESQQLERVLTEHIDAARDQAIRVQDALYAAQWRSLSPASQRILRALTQENDLMLTSTAALARFSLGPKSTVSHTAGRLVDDEVLVPRDAGGYEFDDPFFQRWIELRVLPTLGLSAADGSSSNG